MELQQIQKTLKSIVIDVLKLQKTEEQIDIVQPFFSHSPENPGLIGDSLAILEIASVITDTFGVLPGDLNEDAYMNIETLSEAIHTVLKNAA